MKKFTYLFKQTIILFVYLVTMMVIALAIAAIEPVKLTWLKYFLFVLNIALFSFIAFKLIQKTGEEAYKLKHSNDIKRRVIAETGDLYDLNTIKEYNRWDGLYIGLIVCIPLVLVVLVGLILGACGVEESATDLINMIIYGAFVVPVRTINTNASSAWFLWAIIPICLTTYFGYAFGVYKVKKQYDKIDATKEKIYGKK